MSVTKITDLITINAPGKDIVFDGFDFTDHGYVRILGAGSVTIRNCRIYGLDTTGNVKNYWLFANTSNPVRLVVEHCFFGDNAATASGSLYNMIEPHASLSDGSSFSSNYFTENCCSHNSINIYGVVDNAKISVNGNHFEFVNTVRFGARGTPKCEIEMSGNTIDKIDAEYPEYNGLLCIQPFGKQTTTFAGCTLTMNGNTCPGNQLVYAYSGASDTEMTQDTVPAVYIDGEKITLTILH